MSQVDRREFLKDTARAAAALAALNAAAPVDAAGTRQAVVSRKASPSEKVVLAMIGVRGRGRSLARNLTGLKDVEIAYCCDVDQGVIAKPLGEIAAAQGKEPKAVGDFRRALEDPAVDAVVVATPDHWHALASILAMQAGKDVYVEKPVSHNVHEGRVMVQAAARYRRVVQCGTQSRSGPYIQAAIEYLRSGQLGRVLAAKAINSQKRANIGRKLDSEPPKGVDYDMWLGPAPKRPFNVNRFHYNWHWNWDYGTGDIGNDGVHQVDIARWGLGATAPLAVTGTGSKLYFDDDQQTPDTQTVIAEFPRPDGVPESLAGPMLVFEQRIWAPYGENGIDNGNIFYGENGYLVLGRGGWKVFGPDDKPGPSAVAADRDRAHLANFIQCVKSRERPNCPIEEGHASALICHLGNIACRVQRRIVFNAKDETIPGDVEASRLLTRQYRTPWVVPERL